MCKTVVDGFMREASAQEKLEMKENMDSYNATYMRGQALQIVLDKVSKSLEDGDPQEIRDKVQMQSDIYSYTFWKCATSEDTHRIADLFTKCYLTVML